MKGRMKLLAAILGAAMLMPVLGGCGDDGNLTAPQEKKVAEKEEEKDEAKAEEKKEDVTFTEGYYLYYGFSCSVDAYDENSDFFESELDALDMDEQ